MAVTVQCHHHDFSSSPPVQSPALSLLQQPPRYLLIRRANPPDQGQWSLPGGKIHWGESTLEAAKRELWEETNLAPDQCYWFPEPFTTTDAIVVPFTNKDDDNDDTVTFHYLIAHCFARVREDDGSLPPELTPSDDALDAQWYTWAEIQAMQSENTLSTSVSHVIQRAEELSTKGVLL